MSFTLEYPSHSAFYIVGGNPKIRNYLLAYLLIERQRVENGVIINADDNITEALTNADNLKRCQFHPLYDPEITKKFITKHHIDYIESPNARNFFCLLDIDTLNEWQHDIYMTKMFMKHSLYNTLFAFTSQDPLPLSAMLRSNIDYVFIFAENDTGIRRDLFNLYASNALMSFNVFNAYMDRLTPTSCLILNYRSNNPDFVIVDLLENVGVPPVSKSRKLKQKKKHRIQQRKMKHSVEYENNIIGVSRLHNNPPICECETVNESEQVDDKEVACEEVSDGEMVCKDVCEDGVDNIVDGYYLV